MNERNNFETVEIPNILLELNGLRTSSREIDAETIIKAENLLQSSRFVEAGISSWFANLLKNRRFRPEEVNALIQRLESLGTSSAASTEQQLQHGQMIDFLKSLNRDTSGFIKKPFQKGISQYWKGLDDLAQGAEKAGAGANDAELDVLQQGIGNIGSGIESGLNHGLLGGQRILNLLTGGDKELLKANMTGVFKVDVSGLQHPISYQEFFENGYLNAAGGISSGNIVMTSPGAVQSSLQKLSTSVGASAKLKGWLNLGAQIAESRKVVPIAAGVAGTMWGFNQGIKNAPQPSDYDKASPSDSPLSVNPSLNNDPSQSLKPLPSSGLGGTTNGNNIGGLGGQYSPNTNIGWKPSNPNLPSNVNDWLPTSASDYYNLVDRRKSEDEYENIRLAQSIGEQNFDNSVEDVDTVVRNVLTILEQGQPGESTLKQALDYVSHVDAKAQSFLRQYEQKNPQQNPQTQTPGQVPEGQI